MLVRIIAYLALCVLEVPFSWESVDFGNIWHTSVCQSNSSSIPPGFDSISHTTAPTIHQAVETKNNLTQKRQKISCIKQVHSAMD